MFTCTLVVLFGAPEVGGIFSAEPRSVPCCGLVALEDAGQGAKTPQRSEEEYQRRLAAILKAVAEHKKSSVGKTLKESAIFKSTLAELKKMNRKQIETARREIRETKVPTNAKERERYLVRLALLHLSPENARKVGFTPEETKLVAIPKKSEDVWDHIAFSGCFIAATLNGADGTYAACACHCAYIAHQPLPTCAELCNK